MYLSLYIRPVTTVRQCIPARPDHSSLVRIPLLKIHFVKFVRSIFPLSVILNAYTISCSTRSAIHAAQAVLPQHTAPLRLTEINGQGMNLEQRMNERRSYVTDFLLHRTARNMKHVVARLLRILHYL